MCKGTLPSVHMQIFWCVPTQTAFHVGRTKYVQRELGKYIGVRKKVPHDSVYWSQKIPWIGEFFNVLAYHCQNSGVAHCQITI